MSIGNLRTSQETHGGHIIRRCGGPEVVEFILVIGLIAPTYHIDRTRRQVVGV
jgi:hypothetical protein